MFENLSDKLTTTLQKIRGQGKITDANIEAAIKDIRLSLLEADVNFKVVKTFLDAVKAKALGAEVMQSLTAGQQFTKIVHDELVHMLGDSAQEIDVRGSPAVIFLVGLQGAGKTTTAAKLALHVRQQLKKKPGLIRSTSIARPRLSSSPCWPSKIIFRFSPPMRLKNLRRSCKPHAPGRPPR